MKLAHLRLHLIKPSSYQPLCCFRRSASPVIALTVLIAIQLAKSHGRTNGLYFAHSPVRDAYPHNFKFKKKIDGLVSRNRQTHFSNRSGYGIKSRGSNHGRMLQTAKDTPQFWSLASQEMPSSEPVYHWIGPVTTSARFGFSNSKSRTDL